MYACDLKKQNKNKDWKDFFFSCKFYYYSHLCCAEFPCTLGACCFSMMRLVWCVCVCKYCPLGYLCARLQSLTPTFRAVEVFIRDKYERKKYYNKEASATAQVSINNTVCVLQFVSVCYCCGSMQRCHGWRRFHVTSVWVVAWWLFDWCA